MSIHNMLSGLLPPSSPDLESVQEAGEEDCGWIHEQQKLREEINEQKVPLPFPGIIINMPGLTLRSQMELVTSSQFHFITGMITYPQYS